MKQAKSSVSTPEVLTDLKEIAALAPQWDALLERSRCNRAFSSAAWYLAALCSFPDLSPYVIVTRRGVKLAAVLPLAISQATLRFPTYLSDYNDIVARPDDLAASMQLLTFVLATPSAYEKISLTDLRKDSNCLRAFEIVRTDRRLEPELYTNCPHVRFSPGSAKYAEYLQSRSRAFRDGLKRAQQRAAKNNVLITELLPETFPASQLSQRFLTLHLDRQSGRSCFAGSIEQAFVHDVLPVLFAERRLRAFALWQADSMLAINLCTVGSDSLCYWNGGFATGARRWSPGKLLLDVGIRQACAEDQDEYDFLRGSEDYKADWTNADRPLYQICI
jgi:CelD/BcsL family acetyltransferase involved in cellulose biosynthesis